MKELFVRSIKIDWNKIEESHYLRNIPALKNVSEIKLSCPITLLVGENGSGKSTLLEALAVNLGFNPEGGTKNYHFSTYDSHSPLYHALTLNKSYHKEK